MDTGMIGISILMGWVLTIYGGLTFLIVKKKNYDLISGFANRPEEEKQYLIENGYTQSLGRVLVISFFLLFISIILMFIPISFGLESGLAIFILFLFGGLLWIQKYEVPAKRKKGYWTAGIVFTVIILLCIGLTIIGLRENEITVEDQSFTISGLYGDEWPVDEINSVTKLDSLPDIEYKTNGFAIGPVYKGKFKVEGLGIGLLFLTGKSSAYVLIETEDSFILFNRNNEQELEKIYQTLR
ncbi:DUF3784 domain-containing protein [Gracilibacillus oryzae]|uniref:DUF3784 domain-containing protein n=1 Tax=Gracilibacillus oryzae TaxID=1672701 RepID=A0A7C8KVC3_9BACI|nr:DUF3784 domain-containing protein [Gracilibacillus oryzae]KAB8138172.1 DUF3784 domain-containing protein [Gracilibacillus oryzae]